MVYGGGASHLHIAKGLWGDDIGITHYDFHQAVRVSGHDSVLRDLRCAPLCCPRALSGPNLHPPASS